MFLTGSSPLARGLLVAFRDRGLRVRIIPARAGFTLRGWQEAQGLGDHPRSRGVYGRHSIPKSVGRGSSPLARGLHKDGRAHLWLAGIIPARAGFTVTARTLVHCGRDHPRSRGVYYQRAFRRSSVVGSSPLARGLRP